MTFFEQELRKMIGGICPTATYVGRACYVELTETNRAKIQFIAPRIVDHYDALQVDILNQKDGPVDSLRLNFKDILGIKAVSNPNFSSGISPYAWTYRGETEWYVYKPTQADYKKIQSNLLNYFKVFDYLKERKPSLDAQIAQTVQKTEKATVPSRRNNPEHQNGR